MNRRRWTPRRIVRTLWRLLASPWRAFRELRRSMTGASVVVLLIGIISLNIVWGYPWTGMFAACVSLLVIGLVANRVMRPRLQLTLSLPASSPAGETFKVAAHLRNRSPLPAMNLRVGFVGEEASRQRRERTASGAADRESRDRRTSVDIIPPKERIDLNLSLRFGERGIHPLPTLSIESHFPFHLFRSSTLLPSDTTMAITPRPIRGDEDDFSRDMLSTLGGWSHQLLAGDALDYTGSREYQTGMPVRRWDFASWARLGRPIVCEYQSPTVQAVTIIADVASEASSVSRTERQPAERDRQIERVLSVAATAIRELAGKLVRVRLYVSCEPATSVVQAGSHEGIPMGDLESQLIRLAAASYVTTQASDENAGSVIDHLGDLPSLVLTARPDAEVWRRAGPGVTVMRVDEARSGPPSPATQVPAGSNTTGASGAMTSEAETRDRSQRPAAEQERSHA